MKSLRIVRPGIGVVIVVSGLGRTVGMGMIGAKKS